MLYSLRGKVTEIFNKSIVVENEGLGYEIFVSKPKSFNVNDEIFLFLHFHHHEENEYLVGFTNQKEKEVFKLLIQVNGVGPKSALQILANTDPVIFLTSISSGNLDFIKSIPGISQKIASQIILELNDYYSRSKKEIDPVYKELREAFKTLKFKIKEIDKVLPYVFSNSKSKEDIFKETLRRLQNAKNM